MLDAQRDAAPANAPREVRRLDYRPPAYLVETVELQFDLHPGATIVRAQMAIRRNPAHGEVAPLRLDGEGLRLIVAALDGEALHDNRYRIEHGALVIQACRTVLRLRQKWRSIRRPIRNSPASIFRAAISSPNARRRVFAGLPSSPTGRT